MAAPGRQAQEALAELWRAIEAIRPDLLHAPPGTFKLGRKTIAKFDESGGAVTAKIKLPGGELGWAFDGPAGGEDVKRFVAAMGEALGMTAVSAPPLAEALRALDPDEGEDGWSRALPAIHDVLRQSSDDAAYEALRKAWKEWKHPEVRRSLATALALHPRSDLLDLLRPALHSEDAGLVAHAVMAVGLARARGGAPDLAALASHPASDVRHAVAQALGDAGGAAEVETLAGLLAEADGTRDRAGGVPAWMIRSEAAKSLGRIGSAAARSRLEARLPAEKHKTAKRSVERALAASAGDAKAARDLPAMYRSLFKVLGFPPA